MGVFSIWNLIVMFVLAVVMPPLTIVAAAFVLAF